MTIPAITPQQRSEALKKAAVVRKGRAEIKAELKSRNLNIGELLGRTNDPVVGGMKVANALAALPGIGKKRTNLIMSELGIMPNRRLRGLGARQREALLQKLA